MDSNSVKYQGITREYINSLKERIMYLEMRVTKLTNALLNRNMDETNE
jgi:hypothetical protein